jgi:hypothetical protein
VVSRTLAMLVLATGCASGCPTPEPEGCPPVEWTDPGERAPRGCDFSFPGANADVLLAAADADTAWAAWVGGENIATVCVQEACDERTAGSSDVVDEQFLSGVSPDSVLIAGTVDAGERWTRPIRLTTGYDFDGRLLDMNAAGESVAVLLAEFVEDEEWLRLVVSDDGGATWDSDTTWPVPAAYGDCSFVGSCILEATLSGVHGDVGLVLRDADSNPFAALADLMDLRFPLPSRAAFRGAFVDGRFAVLGVEVPVEEGAAASFGLIDMSDVSPVYQQIELGENVLDDLTASAFLSTVAVEEVLVAFVNRYAGCVRLDLARGDTEWELASFFQPGGDQPIGCGAGRNSFAIAVRNGGPPSPALVWGPDDTSAFTVLTGTGPGEEIVIDEALPDGWGGGDVFSVATPPVGDGFHWVELQGNSYGVYSLGE